MQQVPAQRDLECGLRLVVLARIAGTATTTPPHTLQGRGQADGTAIFQEHRSERLQQRQRNGLGAHHLRHDPLQEGQQPSGRALGQVAVDGLLVYLHIQAPRKAGQSTGTGVRLLPPAQDQQIGQLAEAHRALAQACLPGQRDGILFKDGAQGSTHACSTHHHSTPVSEKRDYNLPFIFSQKSFFVCWVNSSPSLNLTPMGPFTPTSCGCWMSLPALNAAVRNVCRGYVPASPAEGDPRNIAILFCRGTRPENREHVVSLLDLRPVAASLPYHRVQT